MKFSNLKILRIITIRGIANYGVNRIGGQHRQNLQAIAGMQHDFPVQEGFRHAALALAAAMFFRVRQAFRPAEARLSR